MRLSSPPDDVMPFFIEIIDDKGNSLALPFPPYTLAGPPKDLIKYFTDIAKKEKSGNDFAYAVRLLVNPATLNINLSKIVNRAQTMTGWVEEHWGEELDTITFQGMSAAFVSGSSYTTWDADKMAPVINASGQMPAISYDRRDSLSYKNMRELVKIFGTNGIVYDEYGFVAGRNSIQITYDYGCYRGYFESFDITEESSNPFRFNYTVTFKAEKTIYTLGTRRWEAPAAPEALANPTGKNNLNSLMASVMKPTALRSGPASPPPKKPLVLTEREDLKRQQNNGMVAIKA